jgi:hypothetical protein
MHMFSFTRFVTLLVRVLEVGTVVSLAGRWIGVFVAMHSRAMAPAAAGIDIAANFGFLAILLLLAGDLWLLLTRQPQATHAALRTLAYIVFWIFGPIPIRLGGEPAETAKGPSQQERQESYAIIRHYPNPGLKSSEFKTSEDLIRYMKRKRTEAGFANV